MFNTTVATNLVVALKLVTTTMEPCACPDGIAGCLVAHYAPRTTVTYVEPKIEDVNRGLGVNAAGLSGTYDLWLDADAARGGLRYADCTGPRFYPIRLFVEDDAGRRTFSPTIVGCIHYQEFAKALSALHPPKNETHKKDE